MMIENEVIREVGPRHETEIKVNTKPVIVVGPRLTGLEIKAAAIEQGVAIGLDFQLTERRPNGENKIIGDADTVTVHPGSEFVAVAGDDNS